MQEKWGTKSVSSMSSLNSVVLLTASDTIKRFHNWSNDGLSKMLHHFLDSSFYFKDSCITVLATQNENTK